MAIPQGEVGEDSIQQQHDGVVVMEERGNPAGLRQAPWEKRRRERGRAAPTRDQIVCYGQPLGLIYIGEGEGCAPFRVSHPKGWRPASRWHLVRRPRGGEESILPKAPRRCLPPLGLSLSLISWHIGLLGLVPLAHIGQGAPPTAHVAPRGWWTPGPLSALPVQY